MKKNKKLMIVLVMAAAIILGLYWGNTSIQTTRYSIKSTGIQKEMSGFTIVQVSDLHNALFGHKQEKLIRKIKAAAPDCIVVTGDLIDSSRTDINKAMDFINGAVRIAPVYYVTGNHEAWAPGSYEELAVQLKEAGVHMMDGQTENLSYEGGTVRLIGIEDPAFQQGGTEKLQKMSEEQDTYTILLSHRPELFETYVADKLDLVFTGHAHGGQFRIPFAGGVIAPDQGLMPKYTAGVFEKDQTQMVVSRGLGNSVIPIRIFNRPELVVVKLQHID